MLNENTVRIIEKTVGYRFLNKGLLAQAFTRSSYHNEHPDRPDNEVLELIGDSVLSLTVLTYFKEQYAQVTPRGLLTSWNEGKFSALKNALVNKHRLAACMEQLGLQKYLLVSRGDSKSDVDREASVKEDLFESIIGAIYIDSGEDFARTSAVVRKMLDIRAIVEESRQKLHISFRNDLQEWCQHKARRFQNPQYSYTQTAENCFTATVRISEIGLTATAQAQNSKTACERAAQEMLSKLAKFSSDHFNPPPQQSRNYIGELLEATQKERAQVPVYQDVSERILPDHSHLFTVSVSCLGLTATGTGASKKEAKHEAAKALLAKRASK